jgi:hypothetical protein
MTTVVFHALQALLYFSNLLISVKQITLLGCNSCLDGRLVCADVIEL